MKFEDEVKLYILLCVGTILGIAGIILIPVGAGQIGQSSEFADSATEESCLMTDWSQDTDCEYNCGEKNDFCDGKQIIYYATSTKCGDTRLIIDGEDFGCDANPNRYDTNGYFMNETYTCYVMPCTNTDDTTRFTFIDYYENKTLWIILVIVGVVFVLITIGICAWAVRKFKADV